MMCLVHSTYTLLFGFYLIFTGVVTQTLLLINPVQNARAIS